MSLDEADLRVETGAPWVGWVTILALGLALVMSLQVLGAIAHAMAIKRVPTGDTGILYRFGVAFGSVGLTQGAVLVVAVVAVSLPPLLGRTTTDRQEVLATVVLGLATVTVVVLAVGDILFVRYYLHANRGVDNAFRFQMATFLIGTLGVDLVVFVASLRALGLRARR